MRRSCDVTDLGRLAGITGRATERRNLNYNQWFQSLKYCYNYKCSLDSELNNKSKALCDLAFVQTNISDSEFMAVKHLDGSVHCLGMLSARSSSSQGRQELGYKVCIQEWVCL